MAKTTFEADELKLPLFFELVKREDGPDRDRIDFHGFVTQEMISRARDALQSYQIIKQYNKITGSPTENSQYLMFLAILFAEIEIQNGPKPDNAPPPPFK